jgi:hypothetical protein
VSRINTEECWWSDPRRTKLGSLVGSLLLADGIALSAWRLAQEFWRNDRNLIPKKTFDMLEGADHLIAANLAEVRGEEVYIRGSSMYHEWIHDSKVNGKKGGKISAKRPRDEKGRLLPSNPKLPDSNNQNESKMVGNEESKQTQAQSNPCLDENPSHSKTIQTNFSYSFSNTKNTYAQSASHLSECDQNTRLEEKTNEESQPKPTRRKKFIPESKFDLEMLYKAYPRKQGKTKGLKRLSREITTQTDFENFQLAVSNYNRETLSVENQYKKHFSSFVSEWRDWITPEPDQFFSQINTQPTNKENL